MPSIVSNTVVHIWLLPEARNLLSLSHDIHSQYVLILHTYAIPQSWLNISPQYDVGSTTILLYRINIEPNQKPNKNVFLGGSDVSHPAQDLIRLFDEYRVRRQD